MTSYKISLLILLFLIFFIFLSPKTLAMPIGTLLYRTSSDGRLYGLNEDELIKIKNGIIKNIYSGHVAIYIGEENGEHYIVEALAGGLQKTPARYFIDSSQGEEFLGAKVPSQATWLQRLKAAEIAKVLSEFSLAYDFDFHHQKGPESGEWTCVGLAEKVYESADMINPYDVSALVYNSSDYSVDITPDGYDAYSRYNRRGDCFSRSKEFSLINPYTKMIMPLPEVFGFNVGKQYEENRYIFLPYSQFLQDSLEDVEVDIELSSDFIEEDIRPNYPSLVIALKWSFINQPLSALKKVGSYFSRNKDIVEVEKEKILENNKIVDNIVNNNEDKTENQLNLELIKEVLQVKKDQPTVFENKQQVETKDEIEPSFKLYQVLSGDTFILNSGEKVSYIGIKAPELKSLGSKEDECLAWVARERSEELLAGKEIILKKDLNLSLNNSGSLLRYVYIKEGNTLKLVNEILANEGLVNIIDYSNNNFFPANNNLITKISQAINKAKEKKLGIYSLACKKKISTNTVLTGDDEFLEADNNISLSLWKKLKSVLAKSENLEDKTKIAFRDQLNTEPNFKDIFTNNSKESNYSKSETSLEKSQPVEPDDVESENNSTNSQENNTNSGSSYSSNSSSNSNSNSSTNSNNNNSSSGDISNEETETEIIINGCLSSLVISRIHADGDDDWLEIYNPCDQDVDLAAEGVRLERSVTGENPNILLRFDVLEDYLFQASSSKILAFSSLKVVRDDASEDLKSEADVIALRDSFTWAGSGYSIFLAKGAVSSHNDEDTIDLVGVGSDSLYFEGSAATVEILENNILSRRAMASSTFLSMQSGEHKNFPPIYDSNNNALDFLLWPLETDTSGEDPITSIPNPSQEEKLLSLWHFNECRGLYSLDSLNSDSSLSFDWQWVKGQSGCALEADYQKEPLLFPLNNNFDANNFSLSWKQKIKDNGRLALSFQNSIDENFILTLSGYYIETKTPYESQLRYSNTNVSTDSNWHKMFLNLSLNPPIFKLYEDDNLILSQDLGQRLENFDILSIRSENGYSSLDELGIFSPSLTSQEKDSLNYPLEPYNLVTREPASLKHYWNFDEGQGSVAVDSVSGSNINLDPSLWANGLNNFALELDGSISELVVPLPAFSNESVAITFWYKNTSTDASGRIYLAFQDETSDVLGLRMSGYITEVVALGNEYRLAETVLPLDCQWHQVAFMYNAYDYNLKITVDGEEKYSYDFPWLSEKPSKIAIRRDNYYFLLDELKIWQGDVSWQSLQ